MAKFHINPEKGPRPCSAKDGQCPYGADAPHFANKIEAQIAFEEALSKEIQPLGSHKRDSQAIIDSRKEEFAKNFESMDYTQIEDFANSSKENHKIIDVLIEEKAAESYEKYLKLAKKNPKNKDSSETVDTETYKSLARDYNADRDRLAELVEAYTESKYYVPNALKLEDPSRIGNALKSTGFAANTSEWLNARFDTVGGSDVGSLAKLDFTPEKELFSYDKSNLARAEKSKMILPTPEEVASNQNMSKLGKSGPLYRGNVWEARIRDNYSKSHPEMKVYEAKDQFVNKDRSWQKINVDGVLSTRPDGEPNGILEIKTGGDDRVWEKGVPVNYRAQTLYYLNATGLEFADIRVELNDKKVLEFRLHANDEVAVGSGVNMKQYIESRVTPWFEGLKDKRATLVSA